MKTIWKYVLSPTKLTADIPLGAKILTAREQHGEVCIWAEVDTEKPLWTYQFEAFGTGHKIPEGVGTGSNLRYVGTAFLEDGALVFHVYQRS